MRYILTKDGIFEVVLISPLGFVRINKGDGTYPDVFEKDIIKQADTIEELCDMVVTKMDAELKEVFLRKVLEELNKTIHYNRLDKYDVSDSLREVYDIDHMVKTVLLARNTIKKIVGE